MWRWTKRVFIVLGRFLSLPHCQAPPISGLRVERSSPRLRRLDISSTSEGIDCICGAPETARLLSSSTRVLAARVLAEASSNPRSLDSRALFL